MRTINIDQRKQAKKYYAMGLNSKEIAKLLDVSYRTVQNWMQSEKWKESIKAPTLIKEKAKELFNSGLSYNEVAKKLNVSRSTAYQYVNKKAC
jgi:transposase